MHAFVVGRSLSKFVIIWLGYGRLQNGLFLRHRVLALRWT